MKTKTIISAVGLFLGLVSATSAATFSFAGGAGDGFNTLNFSSVPAGVTVAVTGWTYNSSSGVTQVTVGQYSGGLGVRNGPGDNSHTVDNSGNIDFLRFAFSTSVTVTNVSLGYVEADGDFKYWAANIAGTSTLFSGGTSVGGGSSPNSYPVNATGSYLWIGAEPSSSNDGFKVSALTFSTPGSATSVPDAGSAVALLGLGLISLFGLQRRFRA